MHKKAGYITLTQLAIFLLALLIPPLLTTNSVSAQLGGIDVFTQKQPYSGKGPNNPSDAFHPGEPVILYAQVHYKEAPLSNELVTFRVEGPSNNTGTVFERVAETNMSGLASVTFTIPSTNNETHIFGNWTVVSIVEFDGVKLNDSLTFRVDWIITIISLRTIDEDLSNRTIFGLDGDVGVEITFRSISMTKQKVAVSLVIQDSLNVPVAFLKIEDLWVQPNRTRVRIFSVLHLPKWATIGTATLHAAALTTLPNLGGVAYSPGVKTTFIITPMSPLTIKIHDVAVLEVIPQDSIINIGTETTIVNITVRNEGTETESFPVNVYHNSTLIDTMSVESLTPYSQKQLSVTWNTSNIALGNYTLSASIPLISEEAETTDNTFINGIVRIQTPPTTQHDIAILQMTFSPSVVSIGNSVYINVTIRNKGNQIESFNVTTYYNFTNPIDTLQVDSLTPNNEFTVSFVWDTGGVAPGNYTLSGFAHPVVGEEAVFDNYLVDGEVTVLPSGEVLHDLIVVGVVAWPSVVEVGEDVFVDVVVRNNGSVVETFNVTAYFDGVEISTSLVSSLVSGGEFTVSFVWDTGGVAPGIYTVKAYAPPVENETNIENNTLTDGTINVISPSPKPFLPDWAIAALISILLLLLLFLIMALLKRRRNRKELHESFNRAWKAWYGRSPMLE